MQNTYIPVLYSSCIHFWYSLTMNDILYSTSFFSFWHLSQLLFIHCFDFIFCKVLWPKCDFMIADYICISVNFLSSFCDFFVFLFSCNANFFSILLFSLTFSFFLLYSCAIVILYTVCILINHPDAILLYYI